MTVLAERGLAAISIVTPGDWNEFDLSVATRRRSILRAVDRACTADLSLRHDRVRLIALLDGLVMRAAATGGFYLAAVAIRDPLSGSLFAASVLMQLGPGQDAPSSRSRACAAVAAAVSSDPAWAGAAVSVASLPLVGEAVRVQVVAGGVLVQYLVPLASRELILTLSSPYSPSMATTDAAIELFDAIAASVALVYDGE